jgi:hypothetical protein
LGGRYSKITNMHNRSEAEDITDLVWDVMYLNRLLFLSDHYLTANLLLLMLSSLFIHGSENAVSSGSVSVAA